MKRTNFVNTTKLLKAYRKESGITQKQIADASKMNSMMVSNAERMKCSPSAACLKGYIKLGLSKKKLMSAILRDENSRWSANLNSPFRNRQNRSSK